MAGWRENGEKRKKTYIFYKVKIEGVSDLK